jgi:AbrB family looped-hinge helix DNA binding protein
MNLPKKEIIMEIALDKLGRILIPKKVRNDLGLKPGTIFRIEESDQEICLKLVDKESHIVNKDGVLVFSGSLSEDITRAVESHRQARLRKIAAWES